MENAIVMPMYYGGKILDEMMNMEKDKHNFMGSTCNHLRMLPIFVSIIKHYRW